MSKKILVETSARHVHVSKEDLATLFGEGYTLTKKKDLSQPGQFACEERVAVIGPKNSFPAVSILGPERKETQVELSASDARSIGVTAPVRESGDLEGSGACKIVGPKGEIEIEKGVIIAKRHIHMTKADAAVYGVEDKQIVSVKVCGERGLIFNEVLIRCGDGHEREMHVDTDEANAAGLKNGVEVEIIK